MFGPAMDAWRSSRRQKLPEAAWRSDPRMSRLAIGPHHIRVLDSGTKGAAVLFAADAPVVLEHYARVLDVLARDRRVIALELPGFGFSACAATYRFSLAEQVEVVLGVCDALKLDRVTIAFSCVNALVALSFAARHPSRVERLVLAQIPSAEQFALWAARIDLSFAGRGVLATPVLGQALTWMAPSFIADKWFEAALPRGADFADYARISRHAYDHGGLFSLAAINQSLAGVSTADVGSPSVPTTILWGEADRTHRKTDKSSSLVWHPSVELVRWEDAGHCPDLEQPARFAELLAGRGFPVG